MSNSRLEKFIYAICGMEVDDLPTPLSRIETLWNCLITGETPDFEPLSRNEKYLMSMLTGDVDALPEPTSRSEKLLYKIATGETDLSDVPGYLSRYEELLKYLIENGGIGGTDFEYVLYTLNDSFSTLYSTAEAPVRSAILMGNTEVAVGKNKCNMEKAKLGWINGATGEENDSNGVFIPVEVTGTITISNYIHTDIRYVYEYDANGKYLGRTEVTTDNVTLVLTQNTTLIKIGFYKGTLSTVKTLQLQVEQGEIATEYEPYNATLVSVRMPVLTTTGKNLFDKEAFYNDWKGKQETYVYKEVVDGEEVLKINNFNKLWADGKGFKISVKKDNPLTMSMKCKRAGASDTMAVLSIRYGDNARATFGQCNSDEWIEVNTKFTPSQDYIEICSGYNVNDYFYIKDVQLEEGSTVTEYEPYKTNILITPQDFVLGKVEEFEDTINTTNGELIIKTKEISYTDSKIKPVVYISKPNSFYLRFIDKNPTKEKLIISDTIMQTNNWGSFVNNNSLCSYSLANANLYITIPNATTVEDADAFLTELNPTFRYVLAESTIKTVVLSTLDQDGQPTKLSTFNDITYVSIEAEDLLPTVDLEVATKIEETLSTLPTLMNDISETQQLLNESIDEQAENIKEVSTAMIEIRNDIL